MIFLGRLYPSSVPAFLFRCAAQKELHSGRGAISTEIKFFGLRRKVLSSTPGSFRYDYKRQSFQTIFFPHLCLMKIPDITLPIIEIPVGKNVQLFIKREDLIHPDISGNKYWKLFYNLTDYLNQNPTAPLLITFGGAYSNHIAAAAAAGEQFGLKTMGIIRGEELTDKIAANSTLHLAQSRGMQFRFVSRQDYKDKVSLSAQLQAEFPTALLIPEGGTNARAVEGIRHMLTDETESFDYLCAAAGTGGTLAGISKFAAENQQVLGFKVVDDSSLQAKISLLSGHENFSLFEAHYGAYGKITDENIRFINDFKADYGIPLDPIYTGKMMRRLFTLIDEGFFPAGSRILAFHTGGLQGISGANELLSRQNRATINLI